MLGLLGGDSGISDQGHKYAEILPDIIFDRLPLSFDESACPPVSPDLSHWAKPDVAHAAFGPLGCICISYPLIMNVALVISRINWPLVMSAFPAAWQSTCATLTSELPPLPAGLRLDIHAEAHH